MNKITLLALFTITLFALFSFGIDREIARQDWLRTGYAKGCVYSINCNYYNNL